MTLNKTGTDSAKTMGILKRRMKRSRTVATGTSTSMTNKRILESHTSKSSTSSR
jgi:hypothetical protein